MRKLMIFVFFLSSMSCSVVKVNDAEIAYKVINDSMKFYGSRGYYLYDKAVSFEVFKRYFTKSFILNSLGNMGSFEDMSFIKDYSNKQLEDVLQLNDIPNLEYNNKYMKSISLTSKIRKEGATIFLSRPIYFKKADVYAMYKKTVFIYVSVEEYEAIDFYKKNEKGVWEIFYTVLIGLS